MSNIYETLINIVGVDNVLVDESLAQHSSWKIGGTADFFITPVNVGQLAALRILFHEQNIPYIIIGGGSNLLFDDKGIRGVVIKIGQNLSAYQVVGNEITALAGLFVQYLARIAMRHSWFSRRIDHYEWGGVIEEISE